MNPSETVMPHRKAAMPKSWKSVRLEQLGTFEAGGTPSKTNDDFWGGHIPFVTGADIVDLYIASEHARAFLTETGINSGKTAVCRAQTILIVTRTRVGRVGMAKELMGASQDITAFLCGPEIMPEFLCRYLRSISDHLVESCRGSTIQGLTRDFVSKLLIPLPPLAEQKRIAAILNEQMAAVERARKAAEERLEAAAMLPFSLIRTSISHRNTRRLTLDKCLVEVKNGIGVDWQKHRLVGATKEGIAPGKEGLGKNPERYKIVDPVTVFYNPMRILLGSIAIVDEEDEPGITSPDYVVVKGIKGVLDTRWFYYWFRSPYGAHLIDSLSRGAVRERILFNRLSKGEIVLPDYSVQKEASGRMKEVQKIVGAISQEIMTINMLPQALLLGAFNGKV